MTRTIFITGGSGFIGRAVRHRLAHTGTQVVAPTRAALDLSDPAALTRALERAAPDAVLHLASPGPAARTDDPDLIEIETAIAHVVAGAMPAGVPLIIAGSVAEYGRAGRHREDDDCTPTNAYARAKMRAGQIARDICASRGISVVVARIFGAYGPGEADYRLFPAVLNALAANRPIDLSDGRQDRDFVHVADVAAVLLELAARTFDEPCVVNVGTGRALTVRPVIERLADEVGASRDLLRFGAVPRSRHDQDLLEADTARLVALLGWTPPQRLAAPAPILPLLRGDPRALGDVAAQPRVGRD